MTWQEFETAVIAWVKLCSGLDGVYFENAPRVRVPQVYALLSWQNAEDNDSPDVINVDDSAESLTEIVALQTVYSLQIAVETFDQLAGANARFYLGKLRARARLSIALDSLSASNIAVVSWTPARSADYKVDDRLVCRWLCEVSLRAQIAETAGVTEQTGTIESIELTSEFAEGSDVLPSPPNIIRESI